MEVTTYSRITCTYIPNYIETVHNIYIEYCDFVRPMHLLGVLKYPLQPRACTNLTA